MSTSRLRTALQASVLLLGAPVFMVQGHAAAEASVAVPDAAETLVLIRPLTGPEAQDIQVTVEGAVAESFSAVSASKEEEEELAKSSLVMITMSQEKKYRAYVTGVVEKTQKGRNLTLTVYSGADGEAVGEVKLFAPNMKALEAKVDTQAGKALAKLLQETQVAEAESEETGQKVTLEVSLDDEADAPAPAESEKRLENPPSPLDLNVAFGFMNVDLSYNQPIVDSFVSNNVGFRLQPRPSTPLSLRAAGNLYPGAFFVSNAWADVGVAATYHRSFLGSIRIDRGMDVLEFNLLFTELNVGLRGRVRLSDLEVGMLAGWGQTSTVVQGDNEPFLNNPAQTDPGLFPDMEYTYLRFGVDARAPVMDELSIGGGLSVRLPELGDETGQIAEQRWFPRATATGLDAQLFGLYRLTGGLSAMALVDARFYWMTMHSNAGDIGVSAIAGGAQDRYIGALLGLEYVF